MRYRFLAALLGLAVAGCTSPEPQNLSYSPSNETLMPAPAETPGNTVLPSQPASTPTIQSSAAAAPAVSAAGFPSAPGCAGRGKAPCAPVLQERKCRTVGSVTTCDVPADPDADSRLYTN